MTSSNNLPGSCGHRSHRTRRVSRAIAVTAVLAAACAGLAGCGNDAEGKGDAPVLGRQGEDTAAEVYNFPDGFGNVATKCVGPGLRGYSTRHFFDEDGVRATGNVVVVRDTTCS